jgi:hypothetical protein
MTENKKENIDDLLSRFYSPDQAEQIKNDITQGEQLFDGYCAPQPQEYIINRIKLNISRNRKHTGILQVLVKTIAVAAVVLVASYLLLQNTATQKPAVNNTQNIYRAALTRTDNSITALEKEAELLSGEITAVRLGEDNGTNEQLSDSVGNVETEIIDTENSFWKG